MYKPNELKEDTAGIYKRFPKLSTYKKNVDKWHVDCSEDLARLTKCANGEHFSFSYMSPATCKKLNMKYEEKDYLWTDMYGDLGRLSTNLIFSSYAQCFNKDESWLNTFRTGVTYKYWATKMELVFCEQALIEFNEGRRKQKLRWQLRTFGSVLGFCLSLGWLDYARDLAKKISFGLENGMVTDGYDSYGRRRTQHFLIRLINAYDGDEGIYKKPDLKCAFDVPLFNELVENWDMEFSNEFTQKILSACDRHTHQCRQDSFNNNRYYDFENISLEYYFPLEILSIFYLRKTRGLKIPNIDHPVFSSGLEKVDQTTKPVENNFLKNLLKFARQSSNEI